jgi:hypothetical protein
LKRDVEENVACAGIQLSASKRMDVDAHLLVARARQLEGVRDPPESPMRFCDWPSALVEPRKRCEKSVIDSRGGLGHFLSFANEVCRPGADFVTRGELPK